MVDNMREEIRRRMQGTRGVTLPDAVELLRDMDGVSDVRRDTLQSVTSVDFKFSSLRDLSRPTDTSNLVYGLGGRRYKGGLLRLPRVDKSKHSGSDVRQAVLSAIPDRSHDVVEIRLDPEVDLESGFHYPHVDLPARKGTAKDALEVIGAIANGYTGPGKGDTPAQAGVSNADELVKALRLISPTEVRATETSGGVAVDFKLPVAEDAPFSSSLTYDAEENVITGAALRFSPEVFNRLSDEQVRERMEELIEETNPPSGTLWGTYLRGDAQQTGPHILAPGGFSDVDPTQFVEWLPEVVDAWEQKFGTA